MTQFFMVHFPGVKEWWVMCAMCFRHHFNAKSILNYLVIYRPQVRGDRVDVDEH